MLTENDMKTNIERIKEKRKSDRRNVYIITSGRRVIDLGSWMGSVMELQNSPAACRRTVQRRIVVEATYKEAFF